MGGTRFFCVLWVVGAVAALTVMHTTAARAQKPEVIAPTQIAAELVPRSYSSW